MGGDATKKTGGRGDRNAEFVDVSKFHNILFLPLPKTKPGMEDGKWDVDKDLAGWTLADLHQHIPPKPDNQNIRAASDSYAEFVYFHEFVQEFLYGDKSGGLKLYQRRDIEAVTIDVDDTTYRLDVERLNLYMWKTGTAMLVLEVSWARSAEGGEFPFRLNDILKIINRLRRFYIPYWDSEGKPGEVADKVTWHFADKADGVKTTSSSHAPKDWGFVVGAAKKVGEEFPKFKKPPVLPHWVSILPKEFFQPTTYDMDCIHDDWLQPSDDRLANMTYVSVDEPWSMRRGDLVRLCFEDNPDGDDYPYAARFLDDFEDRHCYDRYWDDFYQTRYMFSGYNFSLIGPQPPRSWDPEKDWIYEDIIRTHFRRHYFQMGLICHFQHAMLLAFSNWISRAVSKLHRDKNEQQFRREMKDIHDRFLRFTHQQWFTGVSNQMQARELYDEWRDHLDLERIYGEVKLEIDSTYQYLTQIEQREQTEEANQLAKIAGLAIMLGLPMAFLGMNIGVPSIEKAWGPVGEWIIYGGLTAIFVLLGSRIFFWSKIKAWFKSN